VTADTSHNSVAQKAKSRRSTAGWRADDDADASPLRNYLRPRLRTNPTRHDQLIPLAEINSSHWQRLAEHALEPNAYYLPDWETEVSASSPGRGHVLALTAWGPIDRYAGGTSRLIGLLPVISAWRAYRLPLAALVNADPYGTLGTPLLDDGAAEDAARRMIQQAHDANMRALVLHDIPLDGAVLSTFTRVLARSNLKPRVLQSRTRAALDATRDAEVVLREALGSKKLKELRRQRKRLADHGTLKFEVANTRDTIPRALRIFFALESSGWKADRGTAMAQHEGDVTFMRNATLALSARGQCEIVTLSAGDTPVASGVVLRHRDRAFWFKLGIDERFAKMSPGVQLALDLTRHLCADPSVNVADSTADANHPMIDPIWRGRMRIGDVLIPLQPKSATVAALHVLLTLRQLVRAPARLLVRGLRALRRHR
jgi:CelD/BcsL family acetyltransferase involved in cellulose biosynthesis